MTANADTQPTLGDLVAGNTAAASSRSWSAAWSDSNRAT
jgi:hypothetical protein